MQFRLFSVPTLTHVENLMRIIKIPMDKAESKDAILIDNSFYVLVLTKLKHMLVHGFYLADEVRYEYSWDVAKTKSQNRKHVMNEDAALRYFWAIGVVTGERIENAFRDQELKARALDSNDRVWANWEDVDPAYREYEWVVLIHGIDTDKFESQLEKFNLEDKGVELSELQVQAVISPVKARIGQFTAHKDGSIYHKSKPVELKPEVKRLVYALILEKGGVLRYEQIVDVLWNEENNTQSYLEESSRTRRNITKRISNIVSEANSALYAYDTRKHLVSAGETSYRLIA